MVNSLRSDSLRSCGRLSQASLQAMRPYKHSDYYGHGMPCPYKPSVPTSHASRQTILNYYGHGMPCPY